MPKAGHLAPANYFSATYQVVKDYIENSQKLKCHKGDDACSVVDGRCEAMNNCNGHGTCSETTGQCICNEGYKFADCSKKAIELGFIKDDGQRETTTGPTWYTMQYSGTKVSEVTITPNVTSSIYLLKGSSSDPNDFNYDMCFLDVTEPITINSEYMGLNEDGEGYSVAVYVDAIDAKAN